MAINTSTIERLFKTETPRLVSWATRYLKGDYASAEDAVQSAFETLWRKRDTVKADNLNSYLLRSVQWNCSHHQRDTTARWAKEANQILSSAAETPESRWQFMMLAYCIKQALTKLPVREANIIQKYFSGGIGGAPPKILLQARQALQGLLHNAL